MSNNVETIIRPQKGILSLNLKELWFYRELLYFFAWRDFKVRYRQTIIGAAWAIIQPLFIMVVFTIVFGYLANMPSEGIPYSIFSFSGIILWTYFSHSLSQASGSLIGNADLISKVYFPRLLLPISRCIVGLLDYCIAAVVLIGLMLYYQIVPTLWILLLPIPLVLSFLLASGMAFWFSSIYVKYRDVGYVIAFFVPLLLYVSPIIYPVSIVGVKYSRLLMINPLTGIITAQRAILLGNTPIDWLALGVAFLITICIFLSGIMYFKHHEKEFADVI